MSTTQQTSLLEMRKHSRNGMAPYHEQRPTWCDPNEDGLAGLEFATISVPLDYSQLKGRTTSVAIVRHKASVPERRRGAMLIAPDDPGTRGTLLTRHLMDSLPADIVAEFDLIGFDHRFSGRSTPFSCDLTPAESYWILHYPKSFEEEVQFQKTIAAKATEHGRDLLPHISSRNIARDMDVIRVALGEEKISFLGYSYGTYLGALYTQMFGQHTDRVVLDSVISPRWVWRGLFLNVAASAETGLMRWAQWAAERDADLQLGATDQAVRANYDRLLIQTDREPLILGGMPVDSGTLRIFTLVLLSTDRTYGFLGDVIRVAVHGGQLEPTTQSALMAMFGQRGENTAAAQLAILCGDWAWPRQLSFYRSDMCGTGAYFPFIGAAMAGVKAGAFWPVPPREPLVQIGPDNHAETILLVQSAFDVFTHASGARELHETLPQNSRLIMLEDASCHRVYPFYGDAAVNGVVTDYLTTGRLPESDMTMLPV